MTQLGEVWHDATSSIENFLHPPPSYNQVPGLRNIVDICRQLASRDSRRPDKAVVFARDVMNAIFFDRSIDLCSIQPGIAYDSPYVAVQELIDASTHFFSIFFDGNEKFADELWHAMYSQIQNCTLPTNTTGDSVIMYCLSGYIVRLLPTETAYDQPVQRNVVRQRVHTPLDLFLPSSPVLNRIRFETDGTEPDRNAIHPRHLKMFCNLVTIFCSVNEFPSPSRLMVLRHLIKQFHIFCTFETMDSDLQATRSAVLANPPFAAAFYSFLYTFLEQCPSASSLQELIGIWLTFCRPWRYAAGDYKDVTNTIFVPFIRNQEKFYRILLGKILRKLSELEINIETSRTMKSILEWTWKEPLYGVVRKLLCLDCRPAARKVLDRLSFVHKSEQRKLYVIAQENKALPWYKSVSNLLHDEETPQITASKNLINVIEPILKEADTHMHTNYLSESLRVSQSFESSQQSTFSPLTKSTSSAFEDTPKRGFLPDHDIDPRTGLLYATALGRKQIFEKERSFDFSQCHSYVPQWQAAPKEYEFAVMVYVTSYLALFFNSLEPIQALGRHYFDDGLLGKVVRVLMDPPCPNVQSSVTSPVFTKTLKQTPPTLRLRIFANNAVLLTILFSFLFILMGIWALIPLVVFLFIILIFYLATTPDVI